MQILKDILFNLTAEIKSVEFKEGEIFPICTTQEGVQFFCTKVEGKEWDYETI